MPSSHEIAPGEICSGANKFHHDKPLVSPCSCAFTRIQRRKSGSDAEIADCMAVNVALLTEFEYSDASIGAFHCRRLLTVFASPLMLFIAAAHATATVGHARISASYAALRTARSLSVASPRTAAMGIDFVPVGRFTSIESCDVRSLCKRPHADEPVVPSSAYRPSSASLIW